MRRAIWHAVASGVTLALAACSDTNAPGVGERFTFRESLTSDVIHLEITAPAGLIEADNLLRSGEARWVLATPRRGNGGFNAPWTWHLDPVSISFAEVTIEACQTRASAIADDLDYWIGFGQVCIWGVVEAREPWTRAMGSDSIDLSMGSDSIDLTCTWRDERSARVASARSRQGMSRVPVSS